MSSSWKLQTGDGRPVRDSAPREMTPGPDNGLVRLYGVTMSGLLPGEYELLIDVRDEVAVKTVQVREPFTVTPGVGVAP